VDGVRMNNLIFRAGHLQNVITVDEMLDNVGFFGPASTLFGSDALGGYCYKTKQSFLMKSKTNGQER
jgi:outer membrane cobalamin receptor